MSSSDRVELETVVVIAGAFAVSMSVLLAGWAIISGRPPAHAEVVDNLTLGMSRAKAARIASRAPGQIVDLALRANPPGVRERLDRLATLAGRPARWSIERLLLLKMILLLAFFLLGLLLVGDELTGLRVLLWFAMSVGGYFAPEAVLHGRGVERQKVIQKEIPDTLDQMTISVEAGLGFEAAMSRAAENGKGPFAEELVRTLQEIRVGVPRRVAYRGLADRTTVTDLRRFVAAILQADTYGIPLVDILRTQAHEIRLKRRQRAEQRAMQIPVKVTFPLVLFILPTLFIVLLGPAVMDIAAAFGN